MQHDILFLYNGAPSPAMLEMVSYALDSGLRPILVLLDRGEKHLIMDSSLLGYDVYRIDVGYSAVDARRILSIPALLFGIKKLIGRELADGGTIVTASFDMLMFARFARFFHRCEIRHQVRDLHALQLGDGMRSRVLRYIERILLRGVQKMIVSSPKFASDYYRQLYNGEIVLLENVPQKSVWSGFQRKTSEDGAFVIGYIGVLRYKESLFALIDAVERLAIEGVKIRVVFAGGGLSADLAAIKDRINMRDIFRFSGPYEYAKDIKQLYQDLNLIYAVYDESNRNCQLAMPNKFYESILSKVPLLVAANTYVGEQALSSGIGEVVSLKQRDNLYELLKSAMERGSWYSLATEELRNSSSDNLHAKHEQALADSIL